MCNLKCKPLSRPSKESLLVMPRGRFLVWPASTTNTFCFPWHPCFVLLTAILIPVYISVCRIFGLNSSVLCVEKRPYPSMNIFLFWHLKETHIFTALVNKKCQRNVWISYYPNAIFIISISWNGPSVIWGCFNVLHNLHVFSQFSAHCMWSHSSMFSHSGWFDSMFCLLSQLGNWWESCYCFPNFS